MWQWFPAFCPPDHLSMLLQLFCYWFLLEYYSCLFFSSSRSLVNISCKGCRYFFEIVSLFLSGIYTKVEMLDLIVLFLIFFSNFYSVFHSSPTNLATMHNCSILSTSLQHLLFLVLLIIVILLCKVIFYCGFD